MVLVVHHLFGRLGQETDGRGRGRGLRLHGSELRVQALGGFRASGDFPPKQASTARKQVGKARKFWAEGSCAHTYYTEM